MTSRAGTVSLFGVVAGLAGIEHGIGEILQGNTAPPSPVFPSWPDTQFFRSVAGEPALSLIPSFLASGVLTLLVSLALIVWVLVFVRRRGSALAILLLSAALLLVGGGFGPPLLGIVLAIGATRLAARSGWWGRRAPVGLRRAASRCWPWALGVAVAAWILVMPGTMILDRLAGLEVAERAVAVSTPAAFLGLIVALLTAYAHDADTGSGSSA